MIRAFVLLTTVVFSLSAEITFAQSNTELNDFNTALANKRWQHGSADCSLNKDPALDVFKADDSSFILRQNKCLNFEAPFIYVLVGQNKILVLDTGALGDENGFSLYKEIKEIVGEQRFLDREVLVVHSHSHGDHHKGDSQFIGQPKVTVIKPKARAVKRFWKDKRWPKDEKHIDLGGREITLIPTPGHQEEALTVYDSHTQWLLTGDSFYPGLIYVKDWDDYRDSIAKLAVFTQENNVSAILGTHIEMKRNPQAYYPIGSTYQPNERALPLTVDELQSLNLKLQYQKKPQQLVYDSFVVKPLSALQKGISKIGKLFGG